MHLDLLVAQLSMQKALYSAIRPLKLNPGQPKILEYLLDHDGAIQKEIADACGVEPATLTVLLSGLEKKDIVNRQQVDGNRRSLHVFLTPEGKKLAAKVRDVCSALDDTALAGFSDVERDALIGYLRRVTANLRGEE